MKSRQTDTRYTHGWLDCWDCYQDRKDPYQYKDWELRHEPGYAGSCNPRILLLGFSKGATQSGKAKQGDYDKVPFAGMRGRVQRILETLELMPQDRGIDEMLTAREVEFGAASLVRCTLCHIENGKPITSGAMITASFEAPEIKKIIRRCADRYLADLPQSLQRVILLGTNPDYIEKTSQLFQVLYPDFEWINPVAFRARGAIWVYAAHPSKANGRFENWVKAQPDDPSGYKCLLAKEALKG